MKTLDQCFKKFNENISLTKTKEEELRTSRDALQKTIADWFKANYPEHMPIFKMQGSFPMKTALLQLDGGEYDIDLGVYISGYENVSKNEFPSRQLFHSWINEATKNETNANNIDKDTCVRITYAKGYHVDLPSYLVSNDGHFYLSNKKDGWIMSDPVGFTKWFIDKVDKNGEQLRRIVKYIKAWKDYNSIPLASIAVTILVANSFSPSEYHDEISLRDTLINIYNEISTTFVCRKPVESYENIFEKYSDTRKEKVLDGLKLFKEKMSKIIESDNCDFIKKTLKSLFGDRFVFDCEEYEKTEKPGVLKSDGRSA